MRAVSISSIASWAAEIAALEATGPLPERVVLVASEAHAHALRVELVTRAPDALPGTRFLTVAAAARAVLHHAGVACEIGEETRRPLRVRKVVRARPTLACYRVDDLRSPGWEAAFAATIEQLEEAALCPDDLAPLDDPRADDLATLWRAVDEDAGTSWTVPRVMTEAYRVLAGAPDAWPFAGPVLAAVSTGITAADALLLHVIPRLTIGVIVARPSPLAARERLRDLLGDAVARLATWPEAREPASARELDVLAEHLFAPPERLAAAHRSRSSGPDGTVSLELHAGVDDELDAAVRWVADEVYRHRTPLQDIAILVPDAGPVATLVADRIAELGWPGERAAVYLAGGRPAVATAAGARLLAMVRAIHGYLPADAMLELLPRLRLAGRDDQLSPRQARALVRALGTAGGNAARPLDAHQWCDRLVTAELDEPARAAGPAIAALVAITAQMIAGGSLGALWRAIVEFATTQLIASRELVTIRRQLDGELRALASDAVTAQIIGADALELIAATLGALRIDAGRHGEPAIFVGTLLDAAGLPFTAVRVLGLAESVFPGTLRADAILPAELRARLPRHTIVRDDELATLRLQAFDRVVRGTRDRLCVSAPRTDLDGSEREPAAVFIELAAALARPDARTGKRSAAIPTTRALERDAFGPAREAARARRLQTPLSAACWLVRAASGARLGPSAWASPAIVEPSAVLERAITPLGRLGPAPLTARIPGVDASLPISASALRSVLACPHQFLLAHVLGFRPRDESPQPHRIDPAAYGTLFHAAADVFARTHGARFGAREADLTHWLAASDHVAHTAFETFVCGYPLTGSTAIESEHRRLARDLRQLVTDDWNTGAVRRLVATERGFGHDPPVALDTAAGRWFVSGRIDRIEVEGNVTLVRDLKTGRAQPRIGTRAEPDVAIDLQLGIYALVTEQLAADWGVPATVDSAYTYVDPFAADRERAFRADRGVLRAATSRWLALATSLIREQDFVQRPDRTQCNRCAFAAVCGDHAAAAAARLRDASGPLGELRELVA